MKAKSIIATLQHRAFPPSQSMFIYVLFSILSVIILHVLWQSSLYK